MKTYHQTLDIRKDTHVGGLLLYMCIPLMHWERTGGGGVGSELGWGGVGNNRIPRTVGYSWLQKGVIFGK
jgi:hypothetical protein